MAILVLGMHRSGTSMVTEIIEALGVYLGPADELIGPSTFNERGHFELLRAVEFDNDLLREAGGTWDAPPARDRLDALAATHRPPIDEWFGGHAAWAFKDPRLCLTLPVWMAALSPESVRVVHVIRDPYATARSLVARNAAMELPSSHHGRGEMTMVDGLGLWAEYNQRACAYTETFGLPRLTLWYDQVLDDPRRQVARLADFLEYRCDDLASKVACVRAELNHHRHRRDGEVP
jgi:hypothetical protein